ncbi:MAG TPA: AAA family ATPase [Armatimonadota bacterium]|nr:AAA family ATPase [Armatimonadota bacterium]
MKLIRFSASKVYGYLNFNINFNDDLSFIVGVNGCGKTTIIRLIQALLTASVRDLNSIEFKKAELHFSDGLVSNSIVAKATDDAIEIRISTVEQPLTIPRVDIDELESRGGEVSRASSYFEEQSIEISNTPVGKALSALDAPIILGLERRAPSIPWIDPALRSERMSLHSEMRRGRRKIFQGTLGVSLMETQALVQDAYRRVRFIQDRQNAGLREEILISAFTYTPIKSLLDIRDLSSLERQESILARRGEIEKTLSGLDSGDKLKRVIGDFFDRFSGLFTRMSQGDSHDIDLELIVNKAQIDRIMNLIKLVDEHKSRIEKAMALTNRFLHVINDFYSDTDKILGIDPVGRLQITRKDGVLTTVEALSSGERQLLIIFANLMFVGHGSTKGVFIIDEPEMSLHLKWQEAFVNSVIQASPDTQLIVATHSPEIVGEHKLKSISLSGGAK